MIVGLPEATPVMMPDAEPIVAKDVLLLTHVPPVGNELKVVDESTHTGTFPEITPGLALTVRTAVAVQPAAVV